MFLYPRLLEGPPVVPPQKYVIVTSPQNVQMPAGSEPPPPAPLPEVYFHHTVGGPRNFMTGDLQII